MFSFSVIVLIKCNFQFFIGVSNNVSCTCFIQQYLTQYVRKWDIQIISGIRWVNEWQHRYYDFGVTETSYHFPVFFAVLKPSHIPLLPYHSYVYEKRCTTESNTLQGYVTSVMDSEGGCKEQKKKKKTTTQKYRGMFETRRSGNRTSSGDIGLNIKILSSPKVGQDQVSRGVSVLCLHVATVTNVLWKPMELSL